MIGSLPVMVMAASVEASGTLGSPIAWSFVAAALVFGGIFFMVAIVKAFTRQTTGWIVTAVVSAIVALIGLYGAISMSAKAATRLVQEQKERRPAVKVGSEPQAAAGDPVGRIRQIVVDHLGALPQDVTPQARFIEDLGAEDQDVFEILAEIEGELGIEIPEEDAASMFTLGDVVGYLEKKRNKVETE